jgi:hypothetical protein
MSVDGAGVDWKMVASLCVAAVDLANRRIAGKR